MSQAPIWVLLPSLPWNSAIYRRKVEELSLAGIRTPAQSGIFCLVSRKERGPKKAKTEKKGEADSGDVREELVAKRTRAPKPRDAELLAARLTGKARRGLKNPFWLVDL